jgi:branched-chain amino acid transport system substrate-binding protein
MRAVLVAGVAAAAFGAISSVSTAKTAHPASGSTVDFYSSLPMQGAETAQTVPITNAIKLALGQVGNKANGYAIKYTVLDDSTAAAGGWDPTKTSANAKQVASDANAAFYIGEFNSGASEVSIPILNSAGIAQVSPANTYVGLTVSVPGASAPGEPAKYYPTGKRTYFRIVPIDTIQGAADLDALQGVGCKKLAIANDGQAYGAGLAKVLGIEAKSYGIKVVYNKQISTTAATYTSVAQAIQSSGATCFEFSGTTATAGTAVAKAVFAAAPSDTILGPDGVCSTGWTENAKGTALAVPPAMLKKMLCTVATLNLQAYPGGKSFLKAYTAKYHVAAGNVDPYAIYGYAAAQVGLAALDKVKAGLSPSAVRAAMVKELHSISSFSTVLGTFKFNAAGDTSLTAYGLYKFNSKGVPVYYKTLAPKYYLKPKA